MESKYDQIKYIHKHLKKSHHHHFHNRHKRKDYSRSRSTSHSNRNNHSLSHSRYRDRDRPQKQLHMNRSRSRSRSRSHSKMDHYKSNSKNYSLNHPNNRNYKSKPKDYYKGNQYTSSHRNNIGYLSNIYSKNNSGIKEEKEPGSKYKNEEKRKIGINISRDKENERYKDKEYDYKESKFEERNYSNPNKSKIIISLYEDKKDNKENKINNNHNNIVSNNNTNNIEFINDNENSRNKVYYYITKNDKMKMLFKIFNNNNNNKNTNNQNLQNQNMTSDNNLSFSEIVHYNSIREDHWIFKFHHKYINSTVGGKSHIEITIRKNDYINNNMNIKDKNYSSIIQVLDSLTFNIEFNINYNSFRSHNSSISNLGYDTWFTTQEITIPPEYYNNINANNNKQNNNQNINLNNNIKNVDIPFVVELLVSKTFNNISKLDDGQYNGIKNEGATCYMNSMLQTLYSIYPFRKAVFQIPTEKDDYSSIILSLQRLFFDLTTNHSPVSARNLIKSFGWTREQIQIQHDVQEFNQLLIEVMENKMRGTPVEGSFSKMFTGKYNNYIECINVDYHKEIEETFNEIQLTVKGYKTIYESFDSYAAEEILDNEDKYETEKYGKQKAKKGIKFLSFPPVLLLQLKRFEYNSKKDNLVKINDYFEYYDEIELTKYLDPSSEKCSKEENTYILHSVIVHQGNANSGHYYAYIKQSKNPKDWLLFNDEHVRPADRYEIFKQNYGGNYEIFKNKGGLGEIVSNNINYERSAYILVYIQKAKQYKFICQNNLDIIPNYLKKRFENEKEDEKNAANKKKRDLENINIFLFSNLNCEYHNNKLGIINSFIDLNIDAPFTYNMTSRLLINFPQHFKISEFLSFINKKTQIPKNEMILFDFLGNEDFSILKRQNFDIIPIDNFDMTLAEYKVQNQKTYLTFFLYVRYPYTVFTNLGTMKDLCEEYKVGVSEEKKGIVFIARTYNKYSFNNNDEASIQKLTGKDNNMNNNLYNNKCYVNQSNLSNISNINKTHLIVIKEYNIIKEEYNIVKIFDINIEEKNIYSKILSVCYNLNKANNSYNSINNNKQVKSILYFILENGYLISDNYYNEENYSNYIIDENNILNYLNKMRCLILIPVSKEEEKKEIISYINNLNQIIYIDINCSKCFGGEENVILVNQKMKKIKIKLTKDLKENDLYNIIHQYFDEKQVLLKLCEKIKIFYIDNLKQIHIVNEEYLKQKNINYTINLLTNNYDKEEMNELTGNEYRDYYILKYFDLQKCRINLELNLYNNSILQEFYYQEFNVFDLYNNFSSKLNVLIPKKIRKSYEILEYLKPFLNYYFGNNLEINNYFFLLQKRNHNYLYQIITNTNNDLKINESKIKDIEYRIQPFLNEEVNKIYNSEYKKIFITFSEFNYFHPMVVYFKPEDTLGYVKKEMALKIEKMKAYSDMIKNKIIINENNNRIDFYLYKGILSQNRMYPDKIIKDDDTIQSVFKDTSGAWNLLISFIKIH